MNEATNHAWNRLSAAWDVFKAAKDNLPPTDTGHRLTIDRWLLPFWKVLGYSTLDKVPHPFVIDAKTYPVSHVRHHSPFHLVGFRQDLDKRVETDGKQFSPHGLVQEFLNRADAHLWGFVSNGVKLRILRDNIRLTRQAFVEFDLQAMFDGKQYADFALLWRLCHESRVTAEKPEQCWLERWSKVAAEQGLRALDQLRTGVENAVKALGRGFLACPANADLKAALKHNRLTPLEYYRQLLRVVYRFLFLFVAEDRELLCAPSAGDEAKNRYTNYYSAARLRRIAERLRGTPHTDLYEGISLVLDKLGTTGCPELAMPALGGLFDPARTPNLAGCRLANSDLLEAVRSLSVINDGQVLRSVDYRNLGAEELGSVYESLLELQPRFDPDAISFTLEAASGNERKTTGSYYTPTSLITCLLDSALDPVLNEAAAKPNPEAAILALKVCDPACGSGHFLIAAAHRIAKKLAAVRTVEDEPAPDAVRHALRDVIGRCIYGVDINPMAVELCQVALWMEALEPGKPLSFLDHHVQCGNSLLGTTPALLAKGIPDEAFEPIEGDDKKVCSALKRQNKEDRNNQGRMFEDDLKPWEQLGNLPAAMAKLEGLPDDTVERIREKERQYASLKTEAAYRTSGRFLADAWCAAFVWKKVKDDNLLPMTHARFRKIEKHPHDIGPQEFAEVRLLADQYQFLHWHLAFPGVFRYPAKNESPDNELTGWCGGFDVVLGNPPWEKLQTEEQQFFSTIRPDIAVLSGSRRKAAIAKLDTEAPQLARMWREQRRFDAGSVGLLRHSAIYPLSAVGKFNSYALFVELSRLLAALPGRVGFIVPSGLATDDTTKLLFSDMVTSRCLVSLFDIENRLGIFQSVHRSYKFSLVTLTGASQPRNAGAAFSFYASAVEDLFDPQRQFTLSEQDIRLLNPNTLTCPTFRSRRDADIAKRIYQRLPILRDESKSRASGYDVQVWRLFNTTDDSDDFTTQSEGFEDGLIPVIEAKTIHQYDHRFATYRVAGDGLETVEMPELSKTDPACLSKARYYVPDSLFRERLPEPFRSRGWFLTLRNIARATDERTIISSAIPRSASCEVTPYVEGTGGIESAVPLLANFNSCIFDYCARQKVGGTHVSYFILNQLPVLPLSEMANPCLWDKSQSLAEWIKPRVLELVYTAHDLKPFAEDCGYPDGPFFWDESRRAVIRAELDAAFFHLYGISEADADYILDTFPIVKSKDEERFGTYRTKEMILRCYQEMQEAIADQTVQTVFASQLDPPPGVPMPKDLFGFPVVPSRRERVIQAFVETRAGWSSEYIVCSPADNARYFRQAETLVPGISEEIANRELWNARRDGQLAHLPKSKTYTPDPKLRRYEFVVEWAFRHVIDQVREETGQRKATTLERILCIPEWRQRFDDLIGELMKKAEVQFSVLDYRWTAMTLRKRAGEKGQATPSLFDNPIPASQAEARLPDKPGVYLIRSSDDRVFTGWADSLKYQAFYLCETGGGSLVPSQLLAGRAPVKTIFYHEVEDPTDGKLHDLWRGNRRAGLPLLNLFA